MVKQTADFPENTLQHCGIAANLFLRSGMCAFRLTKAVDSLRAVVWGEGVTPKHLLRPKAALRVRALALTGSLWRLTDDPVK